KMCCPVGTLRGLLSAGNRSFVPQVQFDSCKYCGSCAKDCPVGLGPHLKRVDMKQCIKCFHCVDACPQEAIKVALYDNTTAPHPLSCALNSRDASATDSSPPNECSFENDEPTGTDDNGIEKK
ncbi:MAG: 4Fe-4S binding protein, partial [Deltaproteobacteria bacterium]|nr:4Fe-4S binding protein [Deltaproteobacteria bacterium]